MSDIFNLRYPRVASEVALRNQNHTLRTRLAEVEAERDRYKLALNRLMREALSFYANDQTWLDQNFPHGDYLSHATVDKGEEARKALATNAGKSLLERLKEAEWIIGNSFNATHSGVASKEWLKRRDSFLNPTNKDVK